MQYPPNQPPFQQQPNTQYPPQQPWQQPPNYYLPQPPPPRPPKKQHPWLTIAIIIFVVAAIAAYGSNISTKNTNPQTNTTLEATPADTPTDTPVPTATLDQSIPTDTPVPTQPPAKWTTTQTFTGNGDKKTQIFNVPDDWKILWSCTDNTGYGISGVLYVEVFNSDNTDFDLSAVSATCSPNKTTSDSTEEHQSGQVYLKILAGLPWKIQIQEFK